MEYLNVTDHRSFGGLIAEADFCTSSAPIAGYMTSRIVASLNFDRSCQKSAKSRDYIGYLRNGEKYA